MTVEELGKACKKRTDCEGCPYSGKECPAFFKILEEMTPENAVDLSSRDLG